MAIDMAKKSQEKSSIFLDPGLGDHSNRERLPLISVFCDDTVCTDLGTVCFLLLSSADRGKTFKWFSLGYDSSKQLPIPPPPPPPLRIV